MEKESYSEESQNNKSDLLVKALSALETIVLAGEAATENLETLKEIPAFKQYFDLPLNSAEELDYKKRFIEALLVAREKNCLPFSLPEDPETIAMLVDNGLTTAKTAYKVAIGELESEDAFDISYDKTVAGILAVVEKFLVTGLPLALNKAVDFIAEKYPPVKTVTNLIKKAIMFMSPSLAKAIKNGLRIVAEKAKPVVKKITETLKTVAGKLKDWLFNKERKHERGITLVQ